MKTKLLKKLRKNFRIVENGLGCQKVQERDFGTGWFDVTNGYEIHLIDQIYEYNDALGLLKAIFDYRYSKYTRKERIRRQKQKQLKTIWYVNS
jgi:hypothetical protein